MAETLVYESQEDSPDSISGYPAPKSAIPIFCVQFPRSLLRKKFNVSRRENGRGLEFVQVDFKVVSSAQIQTSFPIYLISIRILFPM